MAQGGAGEIRLLFYTFAFRLTEGCKHFVALVGKSLLVSCRLNWRREARLKVFDRLSSSGRKSHSRRESAIERERERERDVR